MLENAENANIVLHSPFDVEVHKRTFINYLEVIIRDNGTIEYAVPSHVMKLRSIYGKTTDEIFEEYTKESSGMEPAEWLCDKTGCISVWTDGYAGKPNQKQRDALIMLKNHGVYGGNI